MGISRVRSELFLLALLSGAFVVPDAAAQRAASCATVPSAPASRWSAPLDAQVTLHAPNLSLRDALDRVSALSHVRIVYSSEVVPLDRRSCVDVDNAPLGQVLVALLAGSGAEASVIAGRVVLTPRTGAAPESAEMARDVGTLQRVVVTGSAVASPRRALTIGVEIIDGARLRRESRSTLPDILDVAAPGVWVWERSPSSLVAQYGGIRGASSFNSSYPKIYMDGVEVANPLLVTQLDPNAIDHIEVIRGPQGSALYGSDAISGVINVVTRHDRADDGTSVNVSSTAGAGASAFGAGLVPSHNQRLAYRGGSNLRSTGLALEFGQTGAVTPASATSHLLAAGDARFVGGTSSTTLTARFMQKRAGVGLNPLLSAVLPPTVASESSTPQSVQQYTLGASTIVNGAAGWTHSLLAGVDGYNLNHVSDTAGPFPFGVDSALRAAEGRADRLTLRVSSTGRIGNDDAMPTTITFGAEEAVLRQQGIVSVGTPTANMGKAVYHDAPLESWNYNTGVFTQINSAWRNTVFTTAGLRIEQNDAFSGYDQFPLLPMLGVAVVRELGPMELKLRSAYGKGIRPPQTPARNAAIMQRGDWRILSAGLDPEVQSGVETGAELYFGRTFTLQATRFDQLASGLIQNVTIGVDTGTRSGTFERRVRNQLQNVGAISNHGWEMQATLQHGSLALASALTLVDSRVRTLATGYNGDLQEGDRMLAVPARTMSVTGSWTEGRAFAALSATRASDWTNYDRLRIASDFTKTSANGEPAPEFVGAKLRSYWKEYTGQTRIRLSTSFRLRSGVEATLVGDNLLGGQLDEPDNLTIRPGRTVMGGMRASF